MKKAKRKLNKSKHRATAFGKSKAQLRTEKLGSMKTIARQCPTQRIT